MSLGVQGLNLIQTIDPRIDIQRLNQVKYGVETTATDNTYQVFPIQNFSPSGITAVVNPPNRGNFVNPKWYLNVSFRLTFTGQSGGVGITLLQAAGLSSNLGISPGNTYYDAPRAYALENALDNMQVTINGDAVSTNLNQYHRALTRYHNDVECQDKIYSYEPTMLDQSQQYADLSGFARDPLRGYGDNPLQCPRGGFVGANIVRNDSTGLPGDVAIVDLNLIAPIYLSPLSYACGNYQAPSFIQLDTATIVATFGGRGNGALGGLIASLWSHAVAPVSPATITSTNVSVNEANAYFQYMTPPLDMVVPPTIVYDYVLPIYYNNSSLSSVPAAGAPLSTGQVINLNNIQLTSVPSMMYLWVSKRDQDNVFSDTDTYCPITNVNVTFNNKPGLLANAKQNQLYDICVRNGVNMSYRQFVKDCGSVICLKFGEDIPLQNLITSGVRGSFQFSAAITFNNNYNISIIPQVNALFIMTGTYTISNGRCYREVGLLTESDVLNVRSSSERPMEAPPAYDATGGLAWSDIANFFKRVGRTAINVGKKVVPLVAPEFTPLVSAADLLAQKAGFGKMKGGKKLTRKQMLKLMQN